MERARTYFYRKFRTVFLLIGLLFSAQTLLASNDWTGNTSTDWGTAGNWNAGHVPLSSEVVTIGVVAFKNQPTLNSGVITSITGLTFGPLTSSLTGNAPVTLTINSGSTLNVNGPITQRHNNNLGSCTTNIIGQTLAGVLGGAINCTSFLVGDNTAPPLPLPLLGLANITSVTTVNLGIGNFTVTGTGSMTLNTTSATTALLGIFPSSNVNNPILNLNDGSLYIGNAIVTTNSAYVNTPGFFISILGLTFTTATNLSQVLINPAGNASGTSPTLYLGGASALSLATQGSFVDFYGAGGGISTVNYNGTGQVVYANPTTNLDVSPQVYYNLLLTGSGTKTVNSGTLSVGNNLTNTTTKVDLSVNNPTVTVGSNCNNTSNFLQGSGNITIGGSLTNNSGGALNLGSGNILVAGNYTNSSGGTYTQSSGTTFFNGANQTLVDNSTAGTLFKKVTFQNTGTATMTAGTGNFSLAPLGLLTMVSPAQLVAGSSSVAYLTLRSDTTGTATVAQIPSTSSITGYVTVQRFVQGSATYDAVKQRWKARNYRLLSSAVNEGLDANGNRPYSLNYLGATTIITNCTSTYGATGGNPSLYLYNEKYTPDNSTFISGNFKGVTNISSTTANGILSTTDATIINPKIYVGDGFMIYYRGDKITHITGSPSKTSYPYVAPESVAFSATGNLNQGANSVTSWTGAAGLMFTTSNYPNNAAVQGFNLVGNPYPSSIDWSTFSNSISSAPIYGKNVDPTIYILNPTTNNYDTYIAGGAATGNASKVIPSGQGFFVHANNTSATLTFNESAKTNTQVTGSNLLMSTVPMQAAVPKLLRLKLIADSLNYDDIVIGFNAAASVRYSGNEDSVFLPGYNAMESLSSYSADGVALAINFLPLPKQAQLVIPLNVSTAKSGTYTLKRTELDAIPQLYRVWLMDSYKRDSLDIRNNTDYVFDINLSDTDSFGKNRFKVIIRQDPALNVHLLNFAAAKTSQGAQLTWATENEQNYTNFTIERSTDGGQNFSVLGGFASNAAGNYSFADKTPLIAADSYRLKIEDLNGVISYSNMITLLYGTAGSSAISSNISVYPNPASSVINMAINRQIISTNGGNAGTLDIKDVTVSSPLSAQIIDNTGSYGIRIIDIKGDVIKTAQSTTTTWQTNVSTLTPGTYIIQVTDNTSKKAIGKSVFTKL